MPVFSAKYFHELYVDNTPIAEALATIPVEGSVIVTNDFKFPPGSKQSKNVQAQIPALFGHQAYAANFEFERYPDSIKRLELQQKFFQKPVWKHGRTETVAKQLGWTHLLIYRNAPHPASIPLLLSFENEFYQVYEFKD